LKIVVREIIVDNNDADDYFIIVTSEIWTLSKCSEL